MAMTLFSLLSAWRGPAKAQARAFADIAECREFVMAAVKRQLTVDSIVADPVDPAKFTTTIGDWSSTSNVTNIFGYLKAYPAENVDNAVRRFVNSIVESRTTSIDDSNIVAVVRARAYVEAMRPDVLHEPLGADLVVLYMADRPDSMTPLYATDFPGKDLAEIRKIALKNARQWLPKVVSDDDLGAGVLYFVEDNTMLSTSLILLDEFWKSIAARFPGDVLIALPRKDQLFIFDDDGKPATRAGVRRLIDVTIEDDFNLLSPMLYARRGGKIVVVLN